LVGGGRGAKWVANKIVAEGWHIRHGDHDSNRVVLLSHKNNTSKYP
jgi:hypothetical protein